MPPPSDIRTLIWEETLAADMRRRYFQALAANAASLNAGLRAALPLTTLITFLSAAGVFLTQWTIPLSVIAFAAGLLAAIVTDGSASAEGDVGEESRIGLGVFRGEAVPESRGDGAQAVDILNRVARIEGRPLPLARPNWLASAWPR